MDIRSIKVEIPKIDPTQYLPSIYGLGYTQLIGYRKIEGIPMPPVDINHRKSQVLLKDFIGRVIEELTEGHESRLGALKVAEEYGWNTDNMYPDDEQIILNHIQNANEEQADALGFFITLLSYSNIHSEDIYSYIKKELSYDATTLEDCLQYGRELMYIEDDELVPITLGSYKIIHDHFFSSEAKKEAFLSVAPIFHYLSLKWISVERQQLFVIIYYLNIARNLLKNRPWKQTSVMTKELDFQRALVKSFLLYLGYLKFNGMTQEQLFTLFYKKQQLNLWRQNTGY